MSSTTSIRLSDDLRVELEAVSQRLHRGKNWIISEAIRIYLQSFRNPFLEAEAKIQSLLVTLKDKQDTIWEDNADTQGWV